jgi:RHS repeat-associated core domain
MPLLLWGWVVALWAQTPQPSITLNNIESGATKSYVARENVKLKPGFRYLAAPGQTFNAKIDQTLVFPPTSNTYRKPDGTLSDDPTQGPAVGAVAGQFGVSPTGAATYTIPIECSPGINGMHPSVSIVYNSQLTDGLLGRGFDLAGISCITRVSHGLYYDGDTHGVSFDGKDRFVLDGMRLICDNIADYGKNGTVYFTENNQTSRVKSIGTIGDGPQNFIVETPDGKTLEYGSADDSRIKIGAENGVYRWYLKRIIDQHGNNVEYSYIKWLDQTILSSINYSGGSIHFEYDDVEDTKNNYRVHGNEIKNTVILSSIAVKGKNQYLRNYVLSYDQYHQFLLHQVKVYTNKDGNDYEPGDEEGKGVYMRLPSITFNWSNQSVSSTLHNDLIGSNKLEVPPAYIDFNGDGYDDVFLIATTGSAAEGNLKYTQKILLNKGTTQEEAFSQEINDKSDITVLNSRVKDFVDFDGDGKCDLLYKIRCGILSAPNIVCYYDICFRSLNGTKAFSTVYTGTYDGRKYKSYIEIDDFVKKEFKEIHGDFDGDGKTEIVIVKENNECSLLKYNQGAFASSIININGADLYNAKELIVGDFNGDGRIDIGRSDYGSFKAYSLTDNGLSQIYAINRGGAHVFDLNQDGTSECIFLNNSYGSYDSWMGDYVHDVKYSIYHWNGGNNFKIVEGELLKADIFSQYARNNFPDFKLADNDLYLSEYLWVTDISFDDIDGDGLPEIVALYNRDYNIYTSDYYFNSNSKRLISGFFDDDSFFESGYRNIGENSLSVHTTRNIAVGKFLGDKFVMNPIDDNHDVDNADPESRWEYAKLVIANPYGNGRRIVYGYGTYDWGNANKVFASSVLNNYLPSNRYLVNSIVDSYGNITTVNYKIDEKDFNASSSLSYPFFSYKNGLPVVKSVEQTSPSVNFNRTTTYTYQNDVYRRFKGFLGYLNTGVVDADGITHNTTNKLNTDFSLIIPNEESSSAKKTTTDITVLDKSNKRYALRVDKVTEEDLLTGIKTTKTMPASEYDEYGNPKQIVTNYGDNTGVSSTENYTYTQKGTWYPNKPETYSITKTGASVPSQTRMKEYTYYDNGDLESEITDRGDKNQLTTSYKYDSYGNPTEISVKSAGVAQPRTTTMTYYPSGRFMETKTNPLGEKVTYTWNEENGLLLSEKIDRIGTTSYSYDLFGRLVQTTYPDGVRKAQVLQWAPANNSVKAKYYSYTETSGSAPGLVWYDALGREVLNETYGLEGKKVSVFTEYYADGRKKQVSDPTFNSSAEKWAIKYDTYDSYGRLTSVTTPMGTTTTGFNGKVTTVTSPEGSKETTLNDAGQVSASKVNGKSVYYYYYASGLTRGARPEGGLSITMVYDLQGNRTQLSDPDAGTVISDYNGFGELKEEKQAVHNNDFIITTNNFNDNGTLKSIVRNGETTSYAYDAYNRIDSIEIVGKNKQKFTYDKFDRVTNVQETIGSRVYNHQTEYDLLGRIKKNIYPSGYYTTNTYDNYGNMTEVKDKTGRSIWKAIDENARGQLLHESKGGKITTYTYDQYNLPQSVVADGVINYSYVFDEKGNLRERSDNNNNANQKEKFDYDGHNRLKTWHVNYDDPTHSKLNSIDYNLTTSNIEKKSDLDNNIIMNYGEPNDKNDDSDVYIANPTPGPHALTSISGVPTNFPTVSLGVTYTDFKKIATLTEGDKSYSLAYGVDDQRRKSEYRVGGQLKQTRYYLGDYEEEVDAVTGNVRKIHYLSGGAILIQNGAIENLYYGYSDYQGSLIVLTDENGNVVEKYAYDPWGARRNPADWTQKDTRTSWLNNRGYTGHEHLDAFGIINMNGRVYDPATSMFMSPDPYVQAPGNWLNYNRYCYCFGNPFRYTDPSGEFLQFLLAAAIGGIINVAINWETIDGDWAKGFSYFGIGAASAVTVALNPTSASTVCAIAGGANNVLTQGYKKGWDKIDAGEVFYSSVMAGLTAQMGGVLGSKISPYISPMTNSISSPLFQNMTQQMLTQSAAGFVMGGFFSAMNGEDFMDGAWGGFKMGLVTGSISGMGQAFQDALKNKVNPFTGEKLHEHHSDPKFAGGDPKQKTTTLDASTHRQLHKDMNEFLKQQTNDQGSDMMPRKGNSGLDIRNNFERLELQNSLQQFYDKNWWKYPYSRYDFYKNNNIPWRIK